MIDLTQTIIHSKNITTTTTTKTTNPGIELMVIIEDIIITRLMCDRDTETITEDRRIIDILLIDIYRYRSCSRHQ